MNIKEKRKSLGLTQEECARVCGVNHPNYNRFERGKSKMRTPKQEKLLRFFNDFERIAQEKEILIKYYEEN